MHKRAFQSLKCIFMLVSRLPQPYFDLKKTINLKIGFFNQKMIDEDLRHA